MQKEVQPSQDDEVKIRPQSLDDYMGQDRVVESLRIEIAAALKRGEPLDHCAIHGPPGLGKTTLALIIANELGVGINVTTAPTLKQPEDLSNFLLTVDTNGILFIDEIHRLPTKVEEILYPAMEDFVVDLSLGGKAVRLPLPRFTLLGATTRFSMLSAPLRDRFGLQYRLQFYEPEVLAKIVQRSAQKLEATIDYEAAYEIAARARGTPRIANRYLRRVRNFADAKTASGHITGVMARAALDELGVDYLGLDENDRKILRAIVTNYKGGPVGVTTIAAMIQEDSDTVMDVYEPYLIANGFLDRTPRGRIATAKAYKHLGMEVPE